MKVTHKIKMSFVFLLLTIIISLIILLFSSGCQVLKSKRSVRTDSVSVQRSDSGHVSKKDCTAHNDWEWWRTTLQYAPKGGDTTINNNYYSTNVPQPQVVIIEGGKGSSTVEKLSEDSTWKNRYDSLALKRSEDGKSKETKVLSFWQIIGICAGMGFLFMLIGKLKISLR